MPQKAKHLRGKRKQRTGGQTKHDIALIAIVKSVHAVCANDSGANWQQPAKYKPCCVSVQIHAVQVNHVLRQDGYSTGANV